MDISIYQDQNSDIVSNDNFDNDDLITFQHDSKIINLYYSQLTKYSKHIRDTYLFSDVINRFPQELHEIQDKFQLLPESIQYFFQLLRQNYNVDNDSNLTYIHCAELLKISEILEVRKLSYQIKQYITNHDKDVDFIVQMIQYELKIQKETEDNSLEISNEMEEILTSKINDCLSNEKFKALPIQIIYRIVSKSSTKSINNNKLFDIIMRELSKNYVLFQFLDLQKVSEDRLEDLCEIYSNTDENGHQYFNYLKCNLNLIGEINKRKTKLEETNDKQINKMNELESKIELLQKQFNDSEKVIINLLNELNDSKELKTKVSSLQQLLSDSEKINNQLQDQVNQLQNKLSNSEKEMQKQIDELLLLKEKIEKNEKCSEKNITVEFDNDTNHRFNGIVSYLGNGDSKSVVENGIISVTGSSVYGNHTDHQPIHAVNFSNKMFKNFLSEDKPNSWLLYDFKERKVKPTHYSIKSHDFGGKGQYHPQTWRVEGSDDNSKWDVLDTRSNEKSLDDKNVSNTFSIQNKTNKYYRYLRITQTGVSTRNDNFFCFSSLEYFGSILIQ